ncbi:hypothetical protein [Chryseobacterium potabilaquae]|uniref:Uncharacterized protein n=1 Tax=Chryseobacterium potabilaquae TaxID=2675057 RepID=A0A6N4XA35_9FLAO|nr:hypothetical protein [Chryseobacterium potabilaquae]CAA7197635.1 hypothetical protein CHRY9293_03708 [Chryseobacterium potabilaquae]
MKKVTLFVILLLGVYTNAASLMKSNPIKERIPLEDHLSPKKASLGMAILSNGLKCLTEGVWWHDFLFFKVNRNAIPQKCFDSNDKEVPIPPNYKDLVTNAYN